MHIDELKKDPMVNKLFALINPSDSTKTGYLTAIKHYTTYTGKTPTELIEEAQADIKDGKLMTDRAIFVKLPGYREYLQRQTHARLQTSSSGGTLLKKVHKNIVCYFFESESSSC